MSIKKTPEELLWERLNDLEPLYLAFGDAVKWSRSIMRFIKKKDVQRYQIEHCLGLLEELVMCMQKYIDHGGEDGEEISESGKAIFFDIVLSYSDIKAKYDVKDAMQKQKNKLQDRLKKLQKKVGND